jgi:hypothetical protein
MVITFRDPTFRSKDKQFLPDLIRVIRHINEYIKQNK